MSAPAAAADPGFVAPEDATPVWRLALRDGGIALAALSLWAAADTWAAISGLRLATLLSVLDGVAVGAGLALLAHEWGHFAGARWAGGIAPTRGITSLFPIFDFDMERSSQGAFRAMSVWGNAGHWAVVALLAVSLPLDAAGQVALLAGAFGQAVGASLTEFPVIRRAYAGCGNTESFQGLNGELLRRNRNLGIAAGAVLFGVL